MLDDRFFTIGDISSIPDEYVNKYNMIQSSQFNSDKKFPKKVDNVILILSNVLEAESGCRLFKVGDINKGIYKSINKCISFGVDDEKSPRYVGYTKIFVILKNNLPQISAMSQFNEANEIIPVRYDSKIPQWDEVFDIIEKSKYVKPWYVNLWNAIPVWEGLI